MDRRAAEVAKQNKKPMTFNGVSYGLGDRDFRTKEQKRKELKRQSEMATRIQTRVRGTIARKAYSQKLQAAYHLAIRMKTAFRRIQAQKQLEQLRQQRQHEQVCAVVIQKIQSQKRKRDGTLFFYFSVLGVGIKPKNFKKQHDTSYRCLWRQRYRALGAVQLPYPRWLRYELKPLQQRSLLVKRRSLVKRLTFPYPHSCLGKQEEKELVPRRVGRGPSRLIRVERELDPAIVGNVFTHGILSIHVAQDVGRVRGARHIITPTLLIETLCPLGKLVRRLVTPPVLQRTGCVIVSPGRIGAVS
ncbi:hypothetical protein PsorP6_002304 [Peronosclerospora sorghi]|uniref:Uncharacterized protein n=1 Tax=Peronosclerospora sorghi TaxID=230839 RepID=A0ACC0WU58_9STRA|nr:hypothetical protein PsorP6_002304 [Peronosclerospora sorghi]